MWWHHKAWCQWMERKYRGKHLKKDDAWVSSWKQEERKWMKDDMVTYSKCPRQRMRTTWTLPLRFFVRECIYWQGRGRSQWSRGHIPWDKGSEIGWLLEMQYLESNGSNLEFILWRIGSQWRSARTGVMWQKQGFWETTQASVFWTSCKRAKFERDVKARR